MLTNGIGPIIGRHVFWAKMAKIGIFGQKSQIDGLFSENGLT